MRAWTPFFLSTMALLFSIQDRLTTGIGITLGLVAFFSSALFFEQHAPTARPRLAAGHALLGLACFMWMVSWCGLALLATVGTYLVEPSPAHAFVQGLKALSPGATIALAAALGLSYALAMTTFLKTHMALSMPRLANP